MAAIHLLLKHAVDVGASDLHLTVGAPPLYRIHGDLEHVGNRPVVTESEAQGLLYDIMTEQQRQRFEQRHELDFAYDLPSIGRFRANVFLQARGIGAVLRVIPGEIIPLEDLWLPQAVTDFTRFTRGLVLVTGPTGSGKSTTLTSMIDHINRHRKAHIITIEDPLEYIHQNKQSVINQREIGIHSESFSNALRSAFREDPDVILIGELRDLETISLAITAAETGHLVLATVHTGNAAKTIDRIIDVFPTDRQAQVRTQLSESLSGVISQQLLRRIDGRGRVAAVEVLIGVPALRHLIREGKTYQISSIIQTGRREGMQTMDQAIVDLLKQGQIAPEEAHDKCIDRETFQRYLKKFSPEFSCF
ncbi:type IV pili twitching motility protein PilT [candidate division KSB3 bacterium]|uniref:Type IV pili twitching motility protein PilT n=1 Tax=candidate division KSB3 bacterium TaxID=2044937 RepID=A0A2G6E1F4_9BACT|nr:MAG: type IV pili twitching motility protein PilT [candidate division KSB3 bacterium]PIE28489.1 MAG: type IV pili twitching motility protein PilT [candidate division KSB3 bacterium]